MKFKTHTGEVVSGERLQQALDAVASMLASNAYAVRYDDNYPDCVPEAEKNAIFEIALKQAARVRAGDIDSTAMWLRVNEALTGTHIAFLPNLHGMFSIDGDY